MIMLNVQSLSADSFDIICAVDTTIMSIMFEKLSNFQLKTFQLPLKWGMKLSQLKIITSSDTRIVQEGD